MTLEQLAEKIIEDIKAMTPDERAHVRAKITKSVFGPPMTKIYKT